jgi:hypothetical protein
MYRITVGKWNYRYMVGPYTIGIIPPSREKHIASIADVRQGATGPTGLNNGTADARVLPEEVAAYIVAQGLK